jgi:hypothetical protein
MKKLLIPAFLIVSSLLLSACDLKDQAKLRLLNKVDQKIESEITETQTPQLTPTPIPTVSDLDLLNQLNQDQPVNLDNQFKQLENEF